MKTSKVGEKIKLKNVKVGETNWSLNLYANGDVEQFKENVSIYCYSENQTTTLAKVAFAVKEGQGKEVNKKTVTHNFTQTANSWGFDKFIPHSDINANKKDYLINGNLELGIKILVYGDEKTTIKTEVGQNLDSMKMLEKSNIASDFKECWLEDEFSDVKIKCSGMVFHCHRIVLARRSNYFRAMLKGSYKESQSGVIDMENMDAETFRATLKYIYEGELESLETNAMTLLEASERFELANLKIICEDFLTANYLKLDNVTDTLLMADLYKAKKLKQVAMDMIVSNWDKVSKQNGWKEKLGRASHLIFEIFEAIGAQK